MTRNDAKPWTPAFAGRKEYLEWLDTKWKLAQEGKPQIAILIGERGRGKTRIVQEFFARLSKTDDSRHYWPRELDVGLVPDANAHFAGANVPMPWLWWPISFSETHHGTPLRDAVRHLCHVERIVRQREAKKQQLLTVANNINQLATPVLLPFAGPLAIAILAAASSLRGVARKHYLQQAKTAIQHSHDDKRKQNALIVSLLEAAIKPKFASGKPIPAIIVLDDVHWIDQESACAIQEVLEPLNKQGNRLLVIATSLYHESVSKATEDEPSITDSRSFFTVAARLKRRGPIDVTVQAVGPRIEPDAINSFDSQVSKLFPGITTKQRRALIESSQSGDGEQYFNALLFVERVRLLQQNTRFFKLDGSLNTDGRRWVVDLPKEVSIIPYIKMRFSKLGDTKTHILGAGAVQGLEFFLNIIDEVVTRVPLLGATQQDIRDAVLESQDQYGWVETHKTSARFVDSLIHRAAVDHLKDERDLFNQIQLNTSNVIRQWLTDHRWSKFESAVEKQVFLLLALTTFSTGRKGVTARCRIPVNSSDRRSWLAAAIPLIHIASNSTTPIEVFPLVHAIGRATTEDELLEYATCDNSQCPGWIESLLRWLAEIGYAKLSERVAKKLDDGLRLDLAKSPEDSNSLRRVADSTALLGYVKTKRKTANAAKEAERLSSEALGLRRRASNPNSVDVDQLNELILSLSGCARIHLLLDSKRDSESAVALSDESVRLARKAVGIENSVRQRFLLVGVLSDLGDAMRCLGTVESNGNAEVAYIECVSICRKVSAAERVTAKSLHEQAQALRGIAAVYVARSGASSKRDAIRSLEEALKTANEISSRHGDTSARLFYASYTHSLLAECLRPTAIGNGTAEAVKHLRSAARLMYRVVNDFGGTVRRWEQLAWSLDALAEVARDSNETKDARLAEDAARQALICWKKAANRATGLSLSRCRERAHVTRKLASLHEYDGRFEMVI